MNKNKVVIACILALSLLITAPVMATRYPMITIDNADIDVETIIKDDRIYVPLRFMSEYLGCEVGWTGQTAIIKTPQYYADIDLSIKDNQIQLLQQQVRDLQQKTTQAVQQAPLTRQGYVEGKGYIRPIISGTPKFIQEINKAMDILQDMDPAGYALVCQNVERVWLDDSLDKDEGMTIIARCTGNEVAFSEKFSKDTRFQTKFIASNLVHEAAHSCYFKICTEENYNHIKSETIAYTYQIATLHLVKADQWMIDVTKDAMNRRLN